MRVIFIPGFGEDELIFSKIAPQIKGDHLVLSVWKMFSNEPRQDINGMQYAREFITAFGVTEHDVLIGHSMGGWIAYHVKQLVNCKIILLSSMTGIDRIMLPARDSSILYWAVKKGLFNSFTKWLSPVLSINNKRSKEIVLYVSDLLVKGNRNNINNQLKTILKPVKEVITVQPDLRIHAKKDTILKPPREPYYEVPGDHFSLYTHPDAVLVPITAFLYKLTD